MRTDASNSLAGPQLPEAIAQVLDHCTDCGLCLKECVFLSKYGTPLHIAASYDPGGTHCLAMPFECSLCGLCTAVCPQAVFVERMFLEMRRIAVSRGCRTYGDSCVFLGYEKRGVSRHLSYYALPAGCDTVFFPGCTLPATRPRQTFKLLQHLQRLTPKIGIVLDCCTKPSHDLGRQAYFEAMFGEMRTFLTTHGIRRVIVACPNCHKIFSSYGQTLEVATIYEVLAATGLPAVPRQAPCAVTVHDPCVYRFDARIQRMVREILYRLGLAVEEMPHHGKTALCCGEGASVSCVAPALAHNWTRQRAAEADGRRVVTYCTGCTDLLARSVDTVHLLDLIFGSGANRLAEHIRPFFPLTCFNRLRLKDRLRREFPAAVTRERTFSADAPEKSCRFNRNRLTLLVSLAISKLFALRR